MPIQTRQQLVDQGLVPPLYDIPKDKLVYLSKALEAKGNKSKERELASTKVVVADNPTWWGADTPLSPTGEIAKGSKIYSSDGKDVYIFSRFRTVTISIVTDGGLAPYKHITVFEKQNSIQNPKEEKEMADQLNPQIIEGLSQSDIEKLAEGIEGAAQQVPHGASVPMATSSSFEGEKKEKKDEPLLLPTLQRAIEQTKEVNYAPLWSYNRANSLVHGYLVNDDAKLQFHLKKEYAKENGKKKVKDTVSEQAKSAYLAGTLELSKDDFISEYAIAIKQTRPGPILAAIITMPLAGFIDLVELQRGGTPQPNTAEFGNTKVTKIIRKDLLHGFLAQYFGQGIKEDPKTHGSLAGIVEVKFPKTRKASKTTNNPIDSINPVVKNTQRSSLILQDNYLPRKVYKEIEWNARTTQEEIDTLNISSFINLVEAKAVAKDNQPAELKFDNLKPSDQGKVTRTEDGKITSKFFTKNANEQIAIDVKPFWSKDAESLVVLRFPVKEYRPNKDASKPGRFYYVTYDLLDESLHDNEEVKHMLSINNPKFETFRSAIPAGVLTVDSFREAVRKPSKRSSKKEVTAADYNRLLAAASNNQAMIRDSLSIGNRGVEAEVALLNELFSLQAEESAAHRVG